MTLWYFWLFDMLKPPMSIVPDSSLYENPTGLT
jgi:hypothetical protein